MKKYHIENLGCDDSNEFDIELTFKEIKAINKQCEELGWNK